MGKPETFRSLTALAAWIVWLLFAGANWIDLAVQGRDHGSAVAAAILLLATGFGYVTAQRPRIITDDAGVTIRNPLRDYRAGWAAVTKVDLADLLRVHCGQRVIGAWAVHYSRRRKLAAEARARRAANPRRLSLLGLAQSSGAAVAAPETSAAEAEAEKIARQLSERAAAARGEAALAVSPAGTGSTSETVAAWETGVTEVTGAATPTQASAVTGTGAVGGTTAMDTPAWTEPLTSTWSGRAIAALAIPALILLIVCLI